MAKEKKQEELQNYNTAALMGIDITDQEVCEDLNLDMGYANTPKINEAAAKVVFNRNVREMLDQGISKENAMKVAANGMKDAMKLSSVLMKRRKVT